jgi:hypothetical protein
VRYLSLRRYPELGMREISNSDPKTIHSVQLPTIKNNNNSNQTIGYNAVTRSALVDPCPGNDQTQILRAHPIFSFLLDVI